MRRTYLPIAVVLLVSAVGLQPAPALETSWQAPAGSWSEPANWDRGLPTSTTYAYITNGGTAEITQPGATCRDLLLGGTHMEPGVGAVQMSGGDLAAANEYLGYRGSGTFVQSGGRNTLTESLTLGGSSDGTGEYRLSGGELSADAEYIGQGGAGTFIQTGGTNRVQQSVELVGPGPGGWGEYDISGGTLDVADGLIRVGQWEWGCGKFLLNGGRVVADQFDLQLCGYFSANGEGELIVNRLTGFEGSLGNLNVEVLQIGHAGGTGTGSFELEGGQVLAGPNNLVVGSDAPATFTQTGGESVIDGFLILGYEEGGRGTYRLDNGTLRAGAIVVGCEGQGSLEIAKGVVITNTLLRGPNGAVHTNPPWALGAGGLGVNHLQGFGDTIELNVHTLGIGHSGGSGSGSLSLGSGQKLTGPWELWIGLDAPGEVVQSGGLVDSTFHPMDLYVGGMENGPGEYQLSGGTLHTTNTRIGVQTHGLFTQSGGLHWIENKLQVGGFVNGPQHEGIYEISGGRLVVLDSILVGHGAPGEFRLDGGEVTAEEFSLGPNGQIVCGCGNTSTLMVNKLTGFEDRLFLPVAHLKIGGSHGSGSGSHVLHAAPHSHVTGHLVVGWNAPGTFTQLGGDFVVDTLTLGESPEGEGTYELTQGQLAGGDLYVGELGEGTFRQSGGHHVVTGNLYLGHGSDSNGTYEISAGSLSVRDGSIHVGGEGTGEFILNGGETVADTLVLEANGKLSGDPLGGVLLVNNILASQDHVYVPGSLRLGHTWGAGEGAYSLTAAQTLDVAGELRIGMAGAPAAPATFNHTGGTNTVSSLRIASMGEYFLSSQGELNAHSETVDASSLGEGRAVFLQTGGTNHVQSLLYVGCQSESAGEYELSGTGSLSAERQHVGMNGTGVLVQKGGTNATSSLGLGTGSGNGRYDLLGGILTITAPLPSRIWVGSGEGQGTMNLGDAAGTGTIVEEPGCGGRLLVRAVAASQHASGAVRGWGTVELTGNLENNGRIIADGYGVDGRVLDLSGFSSITHDESLGVVQGDGTIAGWYAQNRGALGLPSIALLPGSNTYLWGDDPDAASLELVNSLRMTLTGVNSYWSLPITLLAPDHADLREAGAGTVIGAWKFEPPQQTELSSAELTFRYDDVLAASLGLDEADLRAYQLTDGLWHELGIDIDTGNDVICADGITSLSLFAVGFGLTSSPPNQWNLPGGGSFHDAANWTDNLVPIGPGAVVNFPGNIVGPSIVTVDSPVTVGTISFNSKASYTLAREGAGEITLQPSNGNARINVLAGSHTISAPLSVVGGLTVDTADGTELRIEPAEGFSSLEGAVTKTGTGSLILGPRLLVAGPLNVNEGVLEAGEGVLGWATPGGPPRTITLGPLTTLKASGHVNGLVVDAGGLMSPSTLQAAGPMTVGVLGSTDGYNYAGILDAGPHSVVLLDDDKAEVGITLLGGGSLTGAKGIQLNPATVGFGGFITGSGEIHGVVTAGTPGNPAMGFGGMPPGITVYGDVIGLWNQFDNTTVTGMLHAGFSPAHNPLGPGSNAGTAQFLIGGPLDGEVTFNSATGEYEKTTGDHTQFLVYGVAEGVGAPTVFESLELKLDGDYPDFTWGDLVNGDDIVLIQTAPWQTVQFITLPFPHYETTLVGPGQVEYESSFEGDLRSALDLIRPKLGTGLDVTYTMNTDGLALHIVPEPGTLVLLLSGTLALTIGWWRRRRKDGKS